MRAYGVPRSEVWNDSLGGPKKVKRIWKKLARARERELIRKMIHEVISAGVTQLTE
jgi:hypothetical protein